MAELARFGCVIPVPRSLYSDRPARDFYLGHVWQEQIESKGGNLAPEDPTWHVAQYVFIDPDGSERCCEPDEDWDIAWIHMTGWAITP